MQGTGTVQRYANDPRLLGKRLENGLADPPHRVRDEFDTLRLVELVRRANEAEVALVDQIGKRDALVLILLGHRYDKAQVRPHQLVERLLVVHADPSRQRRFFIAGNQRIDADVPEILIEGALLKARFRSCLARCGHTDGNSFRRRDAPVRAVTKRNAVRKTTWVVRVQSIESVRRACSSECASARQNDRRCRASNCSRSRTVCPSPMNPQRSPNTGYRASCLDCLRARSSSSEGRSTAPRCSGTDGILCQPRPLA